MDKPNFAIAITGEWPGAGQTTTAKLLAEELQLDRVYAGFLFRKFAHIWQQVKSEYSWLEYEQAINSGEIETDDYLFREKSFNEDWLMEFQENIQRSKDPSIWDKIVDFQSLKALQKPGVVVEGKVAVVLDKLKLDKKLPEPSHPVIKILLTCPTQICAQRIVERKIENQEIKNPEDEKAAVTFTQDQLIERQNDNWQRYQKIYQVDKEELYAKDIHRIATQDLSQEEVVDQIIHIVRQNTNHQSNK